MVKTYYSKDGYLRGRQTFCCQRIFTKKTSKANKVLCRILSEFFSKSGSQKNPFHKYKKTGTYRQKGVKRMIT
jgi:hypothetical protein